MEIRLTLRPRQPLWELSWDAVRTLGLHGRVVE